MLDSAQTILLLVIIILAILLLLLGVQAFFVLRDFRKTIIKANKVLDDVSGISSLAAGLKALGAIFGIGKNLLNALSEKKVKRLQSSESKKTNGEGQSVFKKPIRRFFRGTKPL